MKFTVERETLLKPLQAVQGVVERRQTLPILANVLLSGQDGVLSVTATDMELELVASTALEMEASGETTVPARKLVEICRSLPAGANVTFSVEKDRAVVRSGRSRFTLATLPAAEFPTFDPQAVETELTVPEGSLKRVIELTQYAMAQQDVRYYLNGLLLEISGHQLRAVATDGHRLALADVGFEGAAVESRALIVPRKGVTELQRLLGSGDAPVRMGLAPNQVRIDLPELRFTSKLIDGKFPEYERVIPQAERCDKQLVIDREQLRQALSRASILSNDKYRAIRLSLESNLLRLVASNPEQEQAEDELEVAYEGDSLEIGFNVSYLIDALNSLPAEMARLHLMDSSSSCLITPAEADDCQYVVMPMRL
ncbi:MAG: DNA polymerase III subunit beta [Ectothiorhodospiraceae bacterium]|nr:DNA polymerase III subunit beta [Chromatiales bacterium]MCP5156503.1 DNA polymerase III subunit beta [Ectothiorhodospiraceae bacterium]